MKKLRVKVIVAYDGAEYEGWQVQKVGRGVQELLEGAIESIFGEKIRLHGSSRTDTGVHARGMAAHFDLPAERLKMPISKISLALNAKLPADIRLMEARIVPESFHARFSAKGKQYRYFVYNHFAMDPLLRRTAWHVPGKLDLEAMREALASLKGRQDFAAFANNRNYKMESTIRTISRVDLKKSGFLLTFIIEGDGFLYKMCRGIAGTMIQVGLGRFTPADIPRMLAAKDRSMSGMTAPAHGLVLWKVFY